MRPHYSVGDLFTKSPRSTASSRQPKAKVKDQSCFAEILFDKSFLP
jgi:hypothetical protein